MDATAIAIVSICASALVGLGAPVVSAWLEDKRESRRFTRDIERSDLAELRQVLDETVVAFEAVRLTIRRLCRLLTGRSPGEVQDGLEALTEGGRALLRLHARITVRLGTDHPIARAGEEAHDEIRAIQALLEEWASRPPGETFNWQEEVDLEAQYVAARDAFVEKAVSIAGTAVSNTA